MTEGSSYSIESALEMHGRVTDTENLQKLRRPEGSTDQASCSAD